MMLNRCYIHLDHGRSHRSGWSGFNRTTFQKENNEYLITTTHLIACFVRTQSICYLGVADKYWSSLWWQRRSLYWCFQTGTVIPRQGLDFPNAHSGNQNRCYALHRVIGSVAGRFCTMTKIKMLCLLVEFSALAVSCLEFLNALDLPESSSDIFAVLSRVTVRGYTSN